MISIDIGFCNVCTVTDKEQFLFPATFTEIPEPSADYMAEKETIDIKNMTIYYNGKYYAIGQNAILNGGLSTLDSEDDLRYILSMLTAICYAHRDNPDEDINEYVVQGLPLTTWETNKKRIEELTTGQFNVVFCGRNMNVTIDKTTVFQQGTATFYSLIYSNGLELDKSLAYKRIGIIDIGQKTIDCSWFEEGRPVASKQYGDDYGVSVAYSNFAKILRSRGIGKASLDNWEKHKHLLTRDEMDKEYLALATQIKKSLSQAQWNFKELERAYFTGGGVAKNEDLFKGIQVIFKDLFSEKSYIVTDRVPDCLFSNAKGYRICGTILQRRASSSSKTK